MQPKLSLIIPVYNAESFIEVSILKLKTWLSKQNFPLEIVFVDDCSTDKTVSKIEPYCISIDEMRLISNRKNRGKGFAVKQGMLQTSGKYKVFTDADIPYGLDVVNAILFHLSSGKHKVCIGNRLDENSHYHISMTFMRKLSSHLFTFFVTKFTIDKVGDTQCGIKGFNKQTADKLFSKTRINGFAFDVESIYLCYKYNIDVKRIPVQLEGNSISTINLFNASVRMFIDVLSLPFRYHVLKQY